MRTRFKALVVASACLALAGVASGARRARVDVASVAPTVMFVTQVPFGGDFASGNAVFGNHLPYTGNMSRGGDLWIRYGDGTTRNLTA